MRGLSFRSSRLSLSTLLAVALTGCGAFSFGEAGSGESSGTGTGAGGGIMLPGSGGAGGIVISASGTGTGGNFTPPYQMGSYAYLCGGEAASCVPGNVVCSLIDPGKNNAGLGGGAPGSSTGSSSSSGGGGASDAGAVPAELTCKLAPISGAAIPGCAPTGDSLMGNPCQTAVDCGVGLACIATPSGGLCRPYCCGEVEACPLDTYCAPVPMAEAAVKIPVCLPAYKCKPLDDSSCTNGQTCTIVRDDGTTSCVDPGDGSRGDSCPCAAGQVCSKITNTCLRLCHIGNDMADCGVGSCQGGVMGYPDGIGICVGYP